MTQSEGKPHSKPALENCSMRLQDTLAKIRCNLAVLGRPKARSSSSARLARRVVMVGGMRIQKAEG